MAAACCCPASRRPHHPTGGRECSRMRRVRHRAAAGHPAVAAAATAAATSQPAAQPAAAASGSGAAAYTAGGERRRPQMWRVRPRHLASGQSARASVHGKPGPLVPMHTVSEDFPPGHRPLGAPVCAGGAEAVCVWRVQDGLLAAHVAGTAPQCTQQWKPHEVLDLREDLPAWVFRKRHADIFRQQQSSSAVRRRCISKQQCGSRCFWTTCLRVLGSLPAIQVLCVLEGLPPPVRTDTA